MSLSDLRADGQRLARSLAPLLHERPIVFAIPRGGVMIADGFARALRLPLDVLAARKVFAPGRPDLAIAAVAQGAVELRDPIAIAAARLDDAVVERTVARAHEALERDLERMRGAWPLPSLEGRLAVLVDDAVISGLTMRAAIASLAGRGARRIVVAAPLCAVEAIETVADQAAGVLYLVSASAEVAARMHDSGAHDACPPLGDDEVHDLVARELAAVGVDPFGALELDGLEVSP